MDDNGDFPELEQTKRALYRSIAAAADGILRGNTAIAPRKDRRACELCKYGEICRNAGGCWDEPF